MIALSTASLALAIAAAPVAAPIASAPAPAVPADCLALPAGVLITPGQFLHTQAGPAIALAGKAVCDSAGNRAVVGVDASFQTITSYLAPPPVPAVAAVAGEATGETGDIAGIIAGTSIFGGFLTLFAGGVFLAVRHSYRVNPDPSVTWAGPPLMLAGAGPSVRDRLEGLYDGSPGMYPQPPGDGDLRQLREDLRPQSRSTEIPQSRQPERGEIAQPHGEWDNWGDFQGDETCDIAGISLAQFKQEHDPHGGDFQIENLAYPDMASVAQRRLFDYVKTYGKVNPRAAVWSIFGVTHSSGSSPSAKRYQKAAEWVTQQFKDEGFMPF